MAELVDARDLNIDTQKPPHRITRISNKKANNNTQTTVKLATKKNENKTSAQNKKSRTKSNLNV
jgi:hypothetical protein